MKFESNKKYSAIDMQEVSIAHVIPEGELFKVEIHYVKRKYKDCTNYPIPADKVQMWLAVQAFDLDNAEWKSEDWSN